MSETTKLRASYYGDDNTESVDVTAAAPAAVAPLRRSLKQHFTLKIGGYCS